MDVRDKRDPSEKQLKGIDFVCRILNIEYDGKTTKDANEFLKKYREKAKEVASKKNGK